MTACRSSRPRMSTPEVRAICAGTLLLRGAILRLGARTRRVRKTTSAGLAQRAIVADKVVVVRAPIALQEKDNGTWNNRGLDHQPRVRSHQA